MILGYEMLLSLSLSLSRHVCHLHFSSMLALFLALFSNLPLLVICGSISAAVVTVTYGVYVDTLRVVLGYEMQRRPEPGRWRVVNDRVAGFSGFTVKLDSSAASPTEFDRMHRRYWSHPESSFIRRGPAVLRES